MLKKILLAFCLVMATACTIKFTFSGASIDPNMKTISVYYFQNQAITVSALLAPTFNDALNQKIQRETRLQIIPEGGDAIFEGDITDYKSEPVAISGDEYATKNRLTITVKVKYTDNLNPKNSYERTFTNYADYDSQQMLANAEGTLIPEIVEKLVQDIFNAAFSNW
ncbi:hypothetical protein BN938_2765 [Mucinivorans hirudinis]|uniref:Lipoprotein n=1 Tax=Mucinivorans hirudinis TaxID=1433126 RepID=A0A060RB90_9BACT|nr:hypothetical protein BN938_2765 [Mucinivorans hirudinis]